MVNLLMPHPVLNVCYSKEIWTPLYWNFHESSMQDSVSYHPTEHTHTEALALFVFETEYVGECNDNIFWNVPKICEMQTFLKLFCSALLH